MTATVSKLLSGLDRTIDSHLEEGIAVLKNTEKKKKKMESVKTLLKNKFVVVIGDSVMRSVYKDIIVLLTNGEGTLLTTAQMKAKGEYRFEGDQLIEISEMTNAKSFREVRQYQTDYHLVRFYFVTRCYSSYFETILMDLTTGPRPDLIIMSSCIWDVSR